MVELIEMVEKYNTLITINYGAYFLCFGIFHSKSVIMLVLCLYLAKKHFHPFLLSVFKINDTVSFEDNIFVQFYRLSNQSFPFKVCNTDCIMPGYDKQFIFINFYLVV